MTKKFHKIIIFFLVFFPICSAFSQPSETMRYLLNEPLTLFEWGTYHLEKDLNEWMNKYIDHYNEKLRFKYQDKPRVNYTRSMIIYNSKQNKLLFQIYLRCAEKNLSKSSGKTICEETLNVVKRHLTNFDCLSLTNHFNHFGISDNKKAKDHKKFADDLKRISEISVILSNSKFQTIQSSHSPL